MINDNMYDLSGRRLANRQIVKSGDCQIVKLQRGIYIQDGKKFATR